MSSLWSRAVVFTVGAVLYVGLYVSIVVATPQATPGHAPDFGIFGAFALALSAAIGGYLARLLGVQYPGGGRGPIRTQVSPNQLINVIVWATVVAYVLIGIACGGANYAQRDHPELVPDVVSAEWKILAGLVVAVFVSVLGAQTPPASTTSSPGLTSPKS